MHQVDCMPATGDLIGTAPIAELRPRVDEMYTFLASLLIPHMEAAERSIYPELERILENRQSMAPMRREHAEIRRLVADLGHLRDGLDQGRLQTGEAVTLRRIIFRLYALLKVHLAEEVLYIGIVEKGISPESAAAVAVAMQHAGMQGA
jgi:hypothetical protein